MRATPLLLAALALTACPKKEAPPPEPVEEPEPETTPEQPSPDPAVQDEMQTHFAWALKAQVSVVAGDLEGAKEAHATLRDEDASHTPDPWMPLMADVKAAAARGAEAESLVDAARAVADVGRACGECHTATEGGPNFGDTPAIPEWSEELEMQRHAWASNLMWIGITGPNDEAWTTGAKALSAQDHAEGTPVPDDVMERFAGIEKAVHAAAATAAETSDPDERTTRYAEILSMCATCHTLAKATDD